MIHNVPLIVGRWLRHTDYGVNAKLPDIPRQMSNGDEADEPNPVTIYIDGEDADVDMPEGFNPTLSPALVVFSQSDVVVKTVHNRSWVKTEEPLQIGISYITRDEPATQAKRNAAFVLRAIERTMIQFNDQTASAGYRDLNGISVKAIKEVRSGRPAFGLGHSIIWGHVQVAVLALDTQP